jgi:hypothetical protein
MLENKTPDIEHITHLVQVAELDIARYLQDPSNYHTIEYMESIQMALTEALELLGSNPIPLLENDDE